MQRRGAFILLYDWDESGRGTEEEVEQGGSRAQRFALQNLTFHISHYFLEKEIDVRTSHIQLRGLGSW